ncbi:hypothetical protein [Pseudoduganella violacea]|uniref:Putative transcriptional regulator n=1 Tax=Pseudoduganella violacea TaxID=1715466 RepID=A0A7W5FW61_9BURK|nr:hypothetical protein [Pseudoduganella violacea]MBB3121700.1 putative transcriptional regulator [Pseudoduganella violacea]
MLRALVAGASCEHIAKLHGVTKSTVSQHIRQLAGELQRVVGVLGVDEETSPTAHLIRRYGTDYLEAVEHFVPAAAIAPDTLSGMVTPRQIDQYVAKIARHSRCVRRDTALLLTLFLTAAKPIEIAQLAVSDYLDAAGQSRTTSTLRPEIATGRTARLLHFSCPRTCAAIDAYLAERVRKGWGTHPHTSYRGLDPASRLFLSRDGQSMRIRPGGGTSQQYLCKEIHEIYRRIFGYGGMPGIRTACARQMAARQLKARGAATQEIGAVLGLKKLAVHKLLRNAAPARHS